MRKLFTILASMLVATSLWAQSTSDIGKVLAADGKMYKTVAAATNAGTTASGVIAYWGAAGSVESGNSSYRGMAIALEDAVIRWGSWPVHMEYCTSDNHQCSTATPYCSTVSSALSAKNGIAATQSALENNGEGHWHNAAGNGYYVARPSGASMWAIPSIGQWQLMAQGLTGNSSGLSDTDDNPDYHFNNLSSKINAAGGTYLGWLFYWSSTEKDASSAWCFNIGGLESGRNGSRVSAFAKNHNDEYMHVRMFFAFSSATAAIYTISYNANGGSGEPSAQTKDGGIDMTISNTIPTRAHYVFAGWATTPDGDVAYAAGASYSGNANTTLYAQWNDAPMATVTAPTAKSLTYNGNAQALINAGNSSDGEMQYKLGDGVWSTSIPTATDAGNYTVYYKVVADANHIDNPGSSIAVTIAKDPLMRVVTIANNKYVSIAPGNLQYRACTDTWRFAEHQYDFIGNAAGNTAPSAGQTAWMDLFGWGTSGWNNGQRYMYQPYSTSTNYYDYGVKNPKTADEALTGDYANGDWGVYNSAQLGQGWRTLTRDECRYMIYSRTTTGTVNSTANAIFTNAKILTDGNGTDGLTYNICGVILFPNDFDGSASYSGVTWGTINSPSDWSTTCTTAGWAALEAAGCIFLPAAGSRSGTEVTSAGTWGIYWTSTASAVEYVDDVYIGPSTFSAFGGNYRYLGRSVRLAQDIATAPAAVEGLVYTGSAQNLITAGTTNVGIMKYSLDNSSWSEEIPTAINDGDYTVYFMVEGDANHENFTPTNNSIVVTIGKPSYAITANPDPQHPDTYYSTFYYSLFKYLIPEGVEAYAATIGESDLYLKKIAEAGDVLPESTAVILKSSGPNYTMVPSDASPISISVQNDLDGTDEQMSAPANCYVLSGHSTDNSVTGVGFYQYTGTLGAHKAYVIVGGNAAPKRMRFVFDTETGVESAQSSEVSVQKILRDGQLIIIRGDREYNTQGQIIGKE